MDVNPIMKYLKTLKSVGTISGVEIRYLALYAFLAEMFEQSGLTKDETCEINTILDCLRRKSCLIANIEDFEEAVEQSLGLLMTAGRTNIKTANGTYIRLMS